MGIIVERKSYGAVCEVSAVEEELDLWETMSGKPHLIDWGGEPYQPSKLDPRKKIGTWVWAIAGRQVVSQFEHSEDPTLNAIRSFAARKALMELVREQLKPRVRHGRAQVVEESGQADLY